MLSVFFDMVPLKGQTRALSADRLPSLLGLGESSECGGVRHYLRVTRSRGKVRKTPIDPACLLQSESVASSVVEPSPPKPRLVKTMRRSCGQTPSTRSGKSRAF